MGIIEWTFALFVLVFSSWKTNWSQGTLLSIRETAFRWVVFHEVLLSVVCSMTGGEYTWIPLPLVFHIWKWL